MSRRGSIMDVMGCVMLFLISLSGVYKRYMLILCDK